MRILGIDHICIAVKDLEAARRRYESDLGLEPAASYIAPEEKIRVVRYYVGGVALELIEPTEPESEVAKFIQRRGEGVFLISFRVPDVEEALEELRQRGVKTIDSQPRYLMGNRYAFIHPRELCGVLTEILDGEFQLPDQAEARGGGKA